MSWAQKVGATAGQTPVGNGQPEVVPEDEVVTEVLPETKKVAAFPVNRTNNESSDQNNGRFSNLKAGNNRRKKKSVFKPAKTKSTTKARKPGRRLKKWGDSDQPMPIEDDDDNGEWDQFTENAERFGVQYTFDESLYTSTLDKNSEFYKQNEEQAAILARRIKSQTTENIHMMEERGRVINSVSEEDRFSTVLDKNPAVSSDDHTKVEEDAEEDVEEDAEEDAEETPKSDVTKSPEVSTPTLPPSPPPVETLNEEPKQLNIDPPDQPPTPKEEEEEEEEEGGGEEEGGEEEEEEEKPTPMSDPEKAKSSTLNPDAKAFQFNPEAQEFTPRSITPSTATETAAQPAPSQTMAQQTDSMQPAGYTQQMAFPQQPPPQGFAPQGPVVEETWAEAQNVYTSGQQGYANPELYNMDSPNFVDPRSYQQNQQYGVPPQIQWMSQVAPTNMGGMTYSTYGVPMNAQQSPPQAAGLNPAVNPAYFPTQQQMFGQPQVYGPG